MNDCVRVEDGRTGGQIEYWTVRLNTECAHYELTLSPLFPADELISSDFCGLISIFTATGIFSTGVFFTFRVNRKKIIQ